MLWLNWFLRGYYLYLAFSVLGFVNLLIRVVVVVVAAVKKKIDLGLTLKKCIPNDGNLWSI